MANGNMQDGAAPPLALNTDTKPMTDLKKVKAPKDEGTESFNWAVAIIVGCWVALGALVWSLRKYNI